MKQTPSSQNINRSEKSHDTVLVMLSGGIDSAALVHFYKQRDTQIECMYVDYNQLAANREEKAAAEIANHYGVILLKTHWKASKARSDGFISGRNAFLLCAALLERSADVGQIALGIHDGTEYSDCSPIFVKKVQSLFDLYCNGTVQLATPFISWSKPQIWQFARQCGVPLDLTYSCERGEDQPCGKCKSCLDLEELNAE